MESLASRKLDRQLSEPLLEQAPNAVNIGDVLPEQVVVPLPVVRDVLRKQVDIPPPVKPLVPVSHNWYGAVNSVEAFLLGTSGLEKPVIAGLTQDNCSELRPRRVEILLQARTRASSFGRPLPRKGQTSGGCTATAAATSLCLLDIHHGCCFSDPV